jgi:glycine cleavage system aminomethyltransferase T
MLSTCDYDNTDLDALELGLPEKYISLDMEDDFIGKEALQHKRSQGLKRKLMGIVFDHNTMIDTALTQLWRVDEESVQLETPGYVTSCGFSPRMQTFIGVATLPIELANEGTRLKVTSPDGKYTATVSKMPFPEAQNSLPSSVNFP